MVEFVPFNIRSGVKVIRPRVSCQRQRTLPCVPLTHAGKLTPRRRTAAGRLGRKLRLLILRQSQRTGVRPSVCPSVSLPWFWPFLRPSALGCVSADPSPSYTSFASTSNFSLKAINARINVVSLGEVRAALRCPTALHGTVRPLLLSSLSPAPGPRAFSSGCRQPNIASRGVAPGVAGRGGLSRADQSGPTVALCA